AFAMAAATRWACSAVGEPSVATTIFLYGKARLLWSEPEPIGGRARTPPKAGNERGPEAARSSVLLPARVGPGLGGFRLCRVQLRFDLERDLLADDHATRFQGCVPRHAPVFAVDLRGGAEAGHRDSPGRALDALEVDLQLDRTRLVADREVARDVQARRTGLLHRCASERDGRVLLDLEEIRRPKVVVPLLIAREDARCVERDL